MRNHCKTATLGVFLAAAAGPAAAQYELEDAFPNLSFQGVTDLQAPRDGSGRIFAAQKNGFIYVFPELIGAQPADQNVFLNISSKVITLGEAGLLGLAFHPNYAFNGYFFVYYVTKFPYRNIVARYRVSADPNVADPLSELILIDDSKTNVFHNGGQIAFGAGNLLYIAIGDDTNSSNAQDLTDLLGGILRIAPNVLGAAPAYTIPNDNPFAGNTNGYREEIYAYGMRNPWRFSLDPATGALWVGDVGQDQFEEIDIVESGRNYGWPFMEGFDCYQPAVCDTAGRDLSLPVYSYDHGDGIAVIGGHVYRGTRFPELVGQYVFADYLGTIWSLDFDGVNPPVRTELVPDGPALYTIGVGNPGKNDLYFTSNSGPIYRLLHVPTAAGDGAPRQTRLLGNFPNPFNPSTTIRYQLATTGHVVLHVIAVDGARVRTLDHGARNAGVHELAWKGETDSGSRAASGVYFCRLSVDGVARDAVRMVLVE